MSKLVETVTPNSVPPYRFLLQCRDCTRTDRWKHLDYLHGIAEVHAVETGHTVDITDEEATA